MSLKSCDCQASCTLYHANSRRQSTAAERPDLQRVRAAPEALEQQRHADVLAVLQRVRQREETRRPPCSSRHRRRAGNVESSGRPTMDSSTIGSTPTIASAASARRTVVEQIEVPHNTVPRHEAGGAIVYILPDTRRPAPCLRGRPCPAIP